MTVVKNMSKTMSVLDFPIRVLNMKERADRRKHMTDLLDKISLWNYEFVVPASKEEASESTLLNPNAKPSKKSHQLSNIRIIESMVDYPFFFIFEDDIEPRVPNVVQKMQESFDDLLKVNPDFDILSFETCFQDCLRTTKVTANLHQSYNPKCGGCRLYSQKGAIRLLKHIYEGGLRTQIALDGYVAGLSRNKYLSHYHNSLFRQKSEVFSGDLEGSHSYQNYSNYSICNVTVMEYLRYHRFVIIFLVLAVTFSIRDSAASCLRRLHDSRYKL